MRSYPTYRIEDFYVKSYKEGGLTYQQFLFLHKAADDALYSQNRFIAAIHGVDIEADDNKKSPERKSKATGPVGVSGGSAPMMFGDPDQYSHLSDQERKEQTQKMLKHWRPFGSKMEQKKPVYHPN